MESGTRDRPRLTRKGERTRSRIVAAAARLIHERGVAGTTLEDVRVAAEVSGSQLYHYFADKDELVQAVITYQADLIVGNQRQADLSAAEGLLAWRNTVIAQARQAEAKGGCPLGSLGGQLAETDPDARDLIAAGFGQWSDAITDGMRALHAAGHLPAAISPDDIAATLLAALQGGLLLAQVQRDIRPLEIALDTLLSLAAPREYKKSSFSPQLSNCSSDAASGGAGAGRGAAGPEDVVHALRVVLGKLNRQLREESASRQLTWPQAIALSRLDRFGPASTTELAKAEGMRPQSMGAILAALNAAGYVEASKDPDDGRRTIMSLTPAGVERLEQEREKHQDWLWTSVTTKLTATEQTELRACVTLLGRLLEP
jgi:TetR/AcrR family transcriptional regulator, transcriptional repressor for nem operon